MWNRIEEKFLTEPYTFPGFPLKKRITIFAALVYLLGFIEHLLSHISFLYDRYTQITKCGWEIENYLTYYITRHLSHVFSVLPYNLPLGIWAEFMNFSITIVWNFVDLLIMIISLGIAYRFEQINFRLEYFQGRVSEVVLKKTFIKNLNFRSYRKELGNKLGCISYPFVNCRNLSIFNCLN